MSPPKVRFGIAADEIDAPVPLRQQFSIGREPIECFT
jgi:hypothetical protein